MSNFTVGFSLYKNKYQFELKSGARGLLKEFVYLDPESGEPKKKWRIRFEFPTMFNFRMQIY